MARSRFSTIYTPEHNDDEKEIAAKSFNFKIPGELSLFFE